MTTDVHASDSVWYVDSGASNHMTSHAEWFNEMKELDGPGYVETGDDSAHPIAHVGKVPLKMQDGKMKYLANASRSKYNKEPCFNWANDRTGFAGPIQSGWLLCGRLQQRLQIDY